MAVAVEPRPGPDPGSGRRPRSEGRSTMHSPGASAWSWSIGRHSMSSTRSPDLGLVRSRRARGPSSGLPDVLLVLRVLEDAARCGHGDGLVHARRSTRCPWITRRLLRVSGWSVVFSLIAAEGARSRSGPWGHLAESVGIALGSAPRGLIADAELALVQDRVITLSDRTAQVGDEGGVGLGARLGLEAQCRTTGASSSRRSNSSSASVLPWISSIFMAVLARCCSVSFGAPRRASPFRTRARNI